MRTNIDIDDALLREARRITRARTKRETIHIALRELVAAHKRRKALETFKSIDWDLDLEAVRKARA